MWFDKVIAKIKGAFFLPHSVVLYLIRHRGDFLHLFSVFHSTSLSIISFLANSRPYGMCTSVLLRVSIYTQYVSTAWERLQ